MDHLVYTFTLPDATSDARLLSGTGQADEAVGKFAGVTLDGELEVPLAEDDPAAAAACGALFAHAGTAKLARQ
jgi:hypothetical protein